MFDPQSGMLPNFAKHGPAVLSFDRAPASLLATAATATLKRPALAQALDPAPGSQRRSALGAARAAGLGIGGIVLVGLDVGP